MANKNANFANREVADLMLVDYSTKKLFLNVDWANVTSTSFEGDRVFATGGQGAPNRVQFDGSRTGTLTIEAQVYPVKVFQMLSGNDLGTTANFLKREKVTCTEAGKLTISTAAGTTAIQVFKADDDLGTEVTATVTEGGTEVTVAEATENTALFITTQSRQPLRLCTWIAVTSPRLIVSRVPFPTRPRTTTSSRHIPSGTRLLLRPASSCLGRTLATPFL